MANYNEEAKEEIADAIVDEVVRNYQVAEHDLDVHLHPDWESYVTIEYDYDRVPDNFSWDVVDVRGIVRDNTEYICSLVDVQGSSLSVAPEER